MDAQTANSLLTLAEDAAPQLRGLHARAVLQQLEERYGELLLALEWFPGHGRADDAFRLANVLLPFWVFTRRLNEGSAWFEQVLALPGGDDARRSRALYDTGYLIYWTGDDERATLFQHQAIELAQKANNRTVVALALAGLARTALRTDIEAARRLCREALSVTEGTDDVVGRSSAMHVLGVAAQMAGDFVEAQSVMSRRLDLARERGDLLTVSSEAGNLSMVERQLGNLDKAESLVREAISIAYQRADEMMTVWLMNGLAAVARDRGDFARAAAIIGSADAAMKAGGGAWPPDELAHYNETVAMLTKKMGDAEFERVRALGHAMTLSEAVRFGLGGLSQGAAR